MAKYRRTPDKTIVEAVQWYPGVEIEGVYENPTNEILRGYELDEGLGWFDNGEYSQPIAPGEWVVIFEDRGVKYRLSEEFFPKMWEPVDD